MTKSFIRGSEFSSISTSITWGREYNTLAMNIIQSSKFNFPSRHKRRCVPLESESLEFFFSFFYLAIGQTLSIGDWLSCDCHQWWPPPKRSRTRCRWTFRWQLSFSFFKDLILSKVSLFCSMSSAKPHIEPSYQNCSRLFTSWRPPWPNRRKSINLIFKLRPWSEGDFRLHLK